MLTQTKGITVERTVPATPKEVYRAFTTPSALGDWLCNAAEVDARKGGRAYFWWDSGYYTAGVFTSIARDESLGFTWRGPNEPEASEVKVRLENCGTMRFVPLILVVLGCKRIYGDNSTTRTFE